MIKIDRFSQASFSNASKTAYLCNYYPYSAVKENRLSMEQWKDQSYSPEILDYKKGQEYDLRFFLAPAHEMIKFVMSQYGVNKSYIVPVPSSIAQDSPDFKSTPRLKGESRNRDNRNIVFCNLIGIQDTNIGVRDYLFRVTSKSAKETWSDEQHAASLGIIHDKVNETFSGLFFLLDDVINDGGTIGGAAMVLQEKFPNATIVKFALGISQHPGSFQPLIF